MLDHLLVPLLELQDLLARHRAFISELLLEQVRLLRVRDLSDPLLALLLFGLLVAQQVEQVVIKALANGVELVVGVWSCRLERVALVGFNFGFVFDLAK